MMLSMVAVASVMSVTSVMTWTSMVTVASVMSWTAMKRRTTERGRTPMMRRWTAEMGRTPMMRGWTAERRRTPMMRRGTVMTGPIMMGRTNRTPMITWRPWRRLKGWGLWLKRHLVYYLNVLRLFVRNTVLEDILKSWHYLMT